MAGKKQDDAPDADAAPWAKMTAQDWDALDEVSRNLMQASLKSQKLMSEVVQKALEGDAVLPKADPLTTDLPCPKCGSPLYLRESKRGFWLSCSTFPKCRGRMAWSAVEEDKQKELEKAFHQHLNDHPVPVLHKTDGSKVEEGYLPQVASAEGEGDGSVEM